MFDVWCCRVLSMYAHLCLTQFGLKLFAVSEIQTLNYTSLKNWSHCKLFTLWQYWLTKPVWPQNIASTMEFISASEKHKNWCCLCLLMNFSNPNSETGGNLWHFGLLEQVVSHLSKTSDYRPNIKTDNSYYQFSYSNGQSYVENIGLLTKHWNCLFSVSD